MSKPATVKASIKLDARDAERRDTIRVAVRQAGLPADNDNVLDSYIYRTGLEAAFTLANRTETLKPQDAGAPAAQQ